MSYNNTAMESRRNAFKNYGERYGGGGGGGSIKKSTPQNNIFNVKEKNAALVMEFPDLSSAPHLKRSKSLMTSLDSLDSSSSNSLYSTAVKTEDIPKAERETYGLEVGQVRYIRDPVTRETIVQSNYYPDEKPIRSPSYNEYVSCVIGRLIQTWDDSKKTLVEMYGEDYSSRYYEEDEPDESTEENIVDSDYDDEFV